MAILGELPLSSGTTKVPGKLAFCPQEPWIFGGSIRQNILFGQPYDKNFYEEVLQLCALEEVSPVYSDNMPGTVVNFYEVYQADILTVTSIIILVTVFFFLRI